MEKINAVGLKGLKMEGNLLVLGNGFDLHCGLKSRFSDFFEDKCLKANEELYSCYREGNFSSAKNLFHKHEGILNFWSYLFYINYYSESRFVINKNKNTNWFDIEELIKDALEKKFSNGQTIVNSVRSSFEAKKKAQRFYGTRLSYLLENPYIFFVFCQENDPIDPYDYLLNELHSFEFWFREYLLSIVKDNDVYQYRCGRFLEEVVHRGERVYLLNFNYTTLSNCVDRECIYSETNLHGNIHENEIIIGIDSESVKTRDLIKFTKTYRNIHRLKQQFALPSPVEVGGIIFYGHSLADADFSYFHSLFDTYKLYDGRLKLTFCYSDFAESEKENRKNHAEYVKRVYDLINKYSERTHNDQNLLHRLILEGRVIIKKID